MENDDLANIELGGEELATPEVISIVPALPAIYDETDERINAILDEVAEFCDHKFTEVPPNPDGEPNPNYDPEDPESPEKIGGVPVAQDSGDISVDIPPETEEPQDPDYGGNEHDNSGAEPYPEQTDELDKLREEYKTAKEKNLEEKKSYWAVLWQVIRLLSDATCWTDSYDDTFIYQYRSQSHTFAQESNCCRPGFKCNKWKKFKLYYAPVDITCRDLNDDRAPQEREHMVKPFIGGEFHWYDQNLDPQITKIDQAYLNRHYNPHTQQVTINSMDFPEEMTFPSWGCGEPAEVELILHYNAGYCSIPKALLPLVCQLMHKIEDSKQSINDCAGAMTQVAGLLKSKKVGNVQYSWSDKDTEASKTQALFTQIYNIANVAELFSISRCDIVYQEEAGDVI